MQGYFDYVVKGSKEEVEDALKLMDSVSKGLVESEYISKENAEDLMRFVGGVEENHIDLGYKGSEFDGYKIYFCMESSGNVNRLSFDFTEMPYALSKMYKELRVEGEGYFLDGCSNDKFISNRGDDNYHMYVPPMQVLVEQYEVSFDTKQVNTYCPRCDSDVTFSVSDIDLNRKLHNVVCSYCGVEVEYEFDFVIEDVLK